MNSVGILEPPAPDNRADHRPGRAAALFGWLGRTVPPLVVFSALGGLLFWGHSTGWTIPKFSSLSGAAADAPDDWCAQHSIPESLCVECQPDLMPRGKAYGWCRTHGVHECPLCHPETAQVPPPATLPALRERARRAMDLTARPENNPICKLYERRIQFATEADADKAGVGVEPAWEAPVVEAIAASGETSYDRDRVARLSARVAGNVWRVLKKQGDSVRQGEVLVLVDAADVGKAKQEFLQALVQARLKGRHLEGLRGGGPTGAIPVSSLREAEAAVSEAQIRLTSAQQALVNLGLPVQADDWRAVPQEQLAGRLQFLGLPEAWAQNLDARTTTGNLLPVTAPLDGMVVSREIVAGEVVDPAKVLFVLADVSRLWLTLDLRMEDVASVTVGKPIRFRPDGAKDEVNGHIAWVSTEVDPKTRTCKVRASLDNADGRLRASTFGAGRIILREEPKALVIPKEALQWEGDCHVVFVRDRNYLREGAPKVFHTRSVRVGVRDGKNAEIIAGLLPGELVAVQGSASLRAELLRGNLGEG